MNPEPVTSKWGEGKARAIADAETIVARLLNGERLRDLAREYRTSDGTISTIPR